jgi:hypothetical protein
MEELREKVWRRRELFAFDTHVPALVGFFREVIRNTPSFRALPEMTSREGGNPY